MPIFALLLGLFMTACSSSAKQPTARPQANPTRPSRLEPSAISKSKAVPLSGPEFLLEHKPLQWSKGQGLSGGKHRRLALLLAADSFADPAMNIAFTNNNLRAMENALTKHCGFQKQDLKTLRGQQLNRDAVEQALLSLTERANAEDNVLLLYFTGHGFIDSKGQPSFFTYYSQQNTQGQGWDKVISRAELALWIAQARAKLELGKQLRALIIIDACRTHTMAPPPRAQLRAGQDWEIYGTGRGTLSAAPQSSAPSPFTRAFAEAVKAGSEQSLQPDLKSIFEETKRRTLSLTRHKQKPELIYGSSKTELRLIVPHRVQFGLELVDALNGALIKNARVTLDSRMAKPSKASFFIETSPNPHLLAVNAPGYLSRSTQLEVKDDHGGSTLKVPLLPNLVFVRGQLDPPQVATIAATGNWPPVRQGYHLLTTQCDAKGRFELRLPSLGRGARVNIKRSGQLIESRALPSQPSYFKQAQAESHDDLGVVDLSVILLDKDRELEGQATILTLSGQQATSFSLPDRLRELPPTQLSLRTAVDKQDFQNMLRAVKAKRWSLARQQVKDLGAKLGDKLSVWSDWIQFQAAKQKSLEDLKARLKATRSEPLARGLAALWFERRYAQAKPLARSCDPGLGPLLRDIEEFEQSLSQSPLRRESRSRRLGLIAMVIREGLLRESYGQLFDLIAGLDQASSLNSEPDWRSLLEEALPVLMKSLLSKALRHGKKTGEWPSLKPYRETFARQRAAWRERQQALKELIKAVERESIPLATRQNFIEAQGYFAEGQWPKAYKTYVSAKDGANKHYSQLIEGQLAFLDDRLAQRYLNEGFEKLLDYQAKAAILAYEKALPHYSGALLRIQRILDQPKNSLSAEFIASKRAALEPWINKARQRKQAAARRQSLQDQQRRQLERQRQLSAERQQELEAERQELLKHGLKDRRHWQALSVSKQDLIVKEVERMLGAEYSWVGTKQYRCHGESNRIASFKHKKTGVLLNLVPGGSYSMGSNSGRPNEQPVHKVQVKAMLIGKYEVTQAEWARVVSQNPSFFKAPAKPVEMVSWNDVVKKWLPKAGGGLRLPSESEWEYACRAGSTTRYFWGETMDPSYCWYKGSSRRKTYAVTRHSEKTNAFGLVDMSGNVIEWCQDNWIASYKNGPYDHSARFSSSSYRVLRGGGWRFTAEFCRSALRYYYTPASRNSNIGFRVVKSLDLNGR